MPLPSDSVLYGTDGNDSLVGAGGNDIISSGLGNDTLNGGAGSDQLYGGAGDDIYIWNPLQGGRDWLADEEGTDTLQINALPSALTFSTTQNGNSLRIQFGHTAHLDIAQYFDTSAYGAHIEKIVFADGTVWTRQQVEAALTGPLLPAENLAPEIIRLDGGRVTEGSGTVDPVVGWIRAHDENGDALTYSLVNDAGGRFYMEGHAIRVADWSLIDYETARSHEVRVRVTDAAGVPTEQTFTIAVLDRQDEGQPPPPPPENHAPTDLFIWAEEVPETATGGYYVGTIFGTDPDNDILTYTIASPNSPFEVRGNQIHVRDGAVLDYETQPLHVITLVASDGRGGSLVRNFDIRLSNEPETPPNHAPQDLWIAAEDIPENATGGYVVGQIFGYDPNGDVLTFTIPTDNDSPFVIIGNQIVLRQGAVLEGGRPISFDILASDGHGGTLQRSFSINVQDVPGEPETPPPHPNPRTIVGTEGDDRLFAPDSNDYTLLGLGGNDTLGGHDGNDTLAGGTGDDTYYADLRYGDQDVISDADGFDRLMIDTGAFELSFVRNLETNSLLISHMDGSSTLEIKGYFDTLNQNGHIEEIHFADGAVWDMEDVLQAVSGEPPLPPPPPPPPENHAPDIIRLTFDWVAENSVDGFIVGTVQAVDPDDDTLTYELVNDAEGRFYMDGNDLRVLDGSRFNDQTNPTHTVRVRVTDEHGLSVEKNFFIRVMDRDGNNPPPPENHDPSMIMLAGVHVDENASNGTRIGQLSAYDPDSDVLTFTLLDDADGRFAIVDGFVVVADGTKLDRETADLHQIPFSSATGTAVRRRRPSPSACGTCRRSLNTLSAGTWECRTIPSLKTPRMRVWSAFSRQWRCLSTASSTNCSTTPRAGSCWTATRSSSPTARGSITKPASRMISGYAPRM